MVLLEYGRMLYVTLLVMMAEREIQLEGDSQLRKPLRLCLKPIKPIKTGAKTRGLAWISLFPVVIF